MTHERNLVQETIDIRVIIDGIIRDHQATNTDLKALAENVERLWRVRAADNTRIKTLEIKVGFLTGLACFTTALAIGGLTLLAFGWWAIKAGL